MIDRQFGEIAFECDGCEASIDTGEEEWNDAMVDFRREGWKAEKVGSEWTHLCPKCQERSR